MILPIARQTTDPKQRRAILPTPSISGAAPAETMGSVRLPCVRDGVVPESIFGGGA